MPTITKWSLNHDRCIKCRSKTRPHRGRGLCARCYHKENEKKYSSSTKITRRKLREKPSKEVLVQAYTKEKKSIGDIANELNYSRSRVSQLLKEYGIATRSLSQARKCAIDKGKVKVERVNEKGETEIIVHQRNTYDSAFFKSWTPEMAYVLGLIFTDGTLSRRQQKLMDGKIRWSVGCLTLTQNSPELLRKVASLMGADVRILHRKRQKFKSTVAGEVFYFHLSSEELYEDLHGYGLFANKSNSMEFPQIPDNCLRHFIRGCWDGDGSFYIEKKVNKVRGDYISGSINFIEGLIDSLHQKGFKKFTIHKKHNTKTPSYYIKVNYKDCIKLFRYLYENTSNSMYLERKYNIVAYHLATGRDKES